MGFLPKKAPKSLIYKGFAVASFSQKSGQKLTKWPEKRAKSLKHQPLKRLKNDTNPIKIDQKPSFKNKSGRKKRADI